VILTVGLIRVPFVFLTNGGGVLESVKAEQLSKKFEVEVSFYFLKDVFRV
jgi:ribonucleotide monophosphatase NagD (HAD superfamily)